MTFTLQRPASHFRTGRYRELVKDTAPTMPTAPPDLSKLTRSTEDALTGVAYRDDALIARLVVAKHFHTDAGTVPYVLPEPGCVIRIHTI